MHGFCWNNGCQQFMHMSCNGHENVYGYRKGSLWDPWSFVAWWRYIVEEKVEWFWRGSDFHYWSHLCASLASQCKVFPYMGICKWMAAKFQVFIWKMHLLLWDCGGFSFGCDSWRVTCSYYNFLGSWH